MKRQPLKVKQTTIKQTDESLPTIDDALDLYYAGTDKSKVKPVDRGNPRPQGFKRAIPPRKKTKEHILTKRESNMYKHIAKVYGDDITNSKKQRKNTFFRRLEHLQEEQNKRDAITYHDEKEKDENRRVEQFKQLKRLRNKFQDEQINRFMSQ